MWDKREMPLSIFLFISPINISALATKKRKSRQKNRIKIINARKLNLNDWLWMYLDSLFNTLLNNSLLILCAGNINEQNNYCIAVIHCGWSFPRIPSRTRLGCQWLGGTTGSKRLDCILSMSLLLPSTNITIRFWTTTTTVLPMPWWKLSMPRLNFSEPISEGVPTKNFSCSESQSYTHISTKFLLTLFRFTMYILALKRQ